MTMRMTSTSTVDICMYVNIKTVPPPALHVGGRITKAPAVKITPQLVRAGMQWRFDQPQNTAKKPVTNEMGYKVMITTLLTQPKDYSIMISMPPPMKHVNDVMSHHINAFSCVILTLCCSALVCCFCK